MKRLRELRKSQNLTLQELSKKLEISIQVLSRYELEEREADYKTMYKIAKYFDVSIDYLLGFSDFYYPDKVQNTALKNMSEKERELLELFRKLSPYLQDLTLRNVRSWAGAPSKSDDADTNNLA